MKRCINCERMETLLIIILFVIQLTIIVLKERHVTKDTLKYFYTEFY